MELDLETNISIYKTLSRENKENIATTKSPIDFSAPIIG